jgi:uncharacterized protein YuzE
MKPKHLDAKGKGEYNYDYVNDIAVFRVKDREYHKSVDFDNFVIDFDKDGYIIGMRIFDASKIFRISKYSMRNLPTWELNARVEDKIVSIRLNFNYILRNKQIARQGENFVREAIHANIVDSHMDCTA